MNELKTVKMLLWVALAIQVFVLVVVVDLQVKFSTSLHSQYATSLKEYQKDIADWQKDMDSWRRATGLGSAER